MNQILAVAAACLLSVPAGQHTVELTAYYHHSSPGSPGAPWQSSVTGDVTGPVIVWAHSEGHPAAEVWRMDGAVVHQCGQLPTPIFMDSYETGSLVNWTHTTEGSGSDATD